MLAKAEAYASKNDIWVAAGSLPQDVPADFYAQLIHLLKNKGVRVFFDANGEALRAGLSDPPFLVNPDISETEDFVGFSIHNYDDAKRAVLPFLRLGVEYVALSIDGLGLLLASQQEMMLATPPKVSIRNVTGAGDALMAGMAYGFAREMDLREIARLGAAFSAIAVTTVSLASVKNSDVEAMLPRVEVRTVNVM